MHTNWNIFGKSQNLDEVKTLILQKRNLSSPLEIDLFLKDENPLNFLKSFPQDFKESLKNAKKFIQEAVEKETPIIIMGDYDADGICATSILYNFFSQELHYKNIFYFIPNRFEHGYGLSKSSVEVAVLKVEEAFQGKKQKPKRILFISVDSGITSVEEALYIKELGHDLIITDHHQKPEILPQADILVWSDKVVGATVAWILSQVLGSKSTNSIALVALATVTDVYPLLGMNRAIVKRGLKVINQSPPIGLRELISVSGLTGKEIGTYELGWVLGPRINASGRLAEASQAVRLFTEADSRIRFQIAQQLNQINKERQDETTRMYDLLSFQEEIPRFILVSNSDFHEGIIGLVASRIVREYYRPSIVISLNGKFGKGSVRSIPGINIIEILREFEEMFENLGGHPMAAGFTIEVEKISQLEEALHKVFLDRFDDVIFVPSVEVDAEVPLDLIDWPLFEFLESLKPFGEGNPSARFVTRKLGIANIDFVGRDKTHTSLKLFDGKKYQKGIYFNSKEKFEELGLGDYIDVIYSVKLSEFNGNRSLDLFIDGIRLSS